MRDGCGQGLSRCAGTKSHVCNGAPACATTWREYTAWGERPEGALPQVTVRLPQPPNGGRPDLRERSPAGDGTCRPPVGSVMSRSLPGATLACMAGPCRSLAPGCVLSPRCGAGDTITGAGPGAVYPYVSLVPLVPSAVARLAITSGLVATGDTAVCCLRHLPAPQRGASIQPGASDRRERCPRSPYVYRSSPTGATGPAARWRSGSLDGVGEELVDRGG